MVYLYIVNSYMVNLVQIIVNIEVEKIFPGLYNDYRNITLKEINNHENKLSKNSRSFNRTKDRYAFLRQTVRQSRGI